MIYSWCKIETVHEGVPYYETCIFTIDPNTGELRKLYSVETDHTYEKPSLFYYGEYVYFYLGYIEESENGDYTTYLELRRFSAKNKEVEDLYISREDVFLGSRMNIWVESGELIYLMPYSVLDGSTSKLYKIEDGELTVAVDFGIKGTGGILDGAAFVGSTVTRQIEVRRFNGNVIFEGDWELDFLSELISGDEADRSLSNAFGDDNELLIGVWLLRKKASVPICLIKYDLTEEDPQATVIAFDPRN